VRSFAARADVEIYNRFIARASQRTGHRIETLLTPHVFEGRFPMPAYQSGATPWPERGLVNLYEGDQPGASARWRVLLCVLKFIQDD